MTLRPTDMLQIQSAIDQYEKRFPRRPAPTAEEALAWRMGKREAAKVVKQTQHAEDGDGPIVATRSLVVEEPSSRKIRLGWFIVRMPRARPAFSEETLPALKGVVLFGWWGMVAVGTASVFALGAFVGGFK